MNTTCGVEFQQQQKELRELLIKIREKFFFPPPIWQQKQVNQFDKKEQWSEASELISLIRADISPDRVGKFH